MGHRSSGLLMHITSLPGGFGVGDLGSAAYQFVDFLAASGQGYWQVLPVNPPAADSRFCPYQVGSAFAGNPLLISIDLLIKDGLLHPKDLATVRCTKGSLADFRLATAIKRAAISLAYKRCGADLPGLSQFCQDNESWLGEYALFSAITRRLRRPWYRWPSGLRDRLPSVIRQARSELSSQMMEICFEQYLFFSQWQALRRYCHKKQVLLFGDLPFYLAADSCDVWVNPDLFCLRKDRTPVMVAGVPPDAFSRTGQLWGNPVYNWSAIAKGGFEFWLNRIGHNLLMFDLLRLDHFRGFAGYWAVKGSSRTAAHGRWLKGPGRDLLDILFERFPVERFVAEDLGTITPDVVELVERYGLMRMRVLQFAFDQKPAKNVHYPHNYSYDCVVYTGTHDNNTAVGWYMDELGAAGRKELEGYVGHKFKPDTVHRELIRLAVGSPASLAIIPVQDVLGLGHNARMNRPGTKQGNWLWRLQKDQLNAKLARDLAAITKLCGRGPLGQGTSRGSNACSRSGKTL